MARQRRGPAQEVRGLVIFLAGVGLLVLGVATGFFAEVGTLAGSWYVDYVLHR